MELNIVDRNAKTFPDQVGISPERQLELSSKLDALVAGSRRLVLMCDGFNEISKLCVNREELIYCTVLHTCWHLKRGHLLTEDLPYGR